MTMNWSRLESDCTDFIQRLIQTPSMPFEEAEIAQLVADELRHLELDEIGIDEMGNVFGILYGEDRSLPKLVLNTHLDHVDPGDPALWPYPPYSGAIADGCIYGRGASDIKGPVGVQVYSIAALIRADIRPKRDIVFTCVVQEEIGGAGAMHWASTVDYPIELLIIGEPSSNRIAVGHRGIFPIIVTFHGRSAHASAPDKAINPNYALATFLSRLEREQNQLGVHPRLGATTVAPTTIEVDTKSRNVSPAWARVCLDFRTATESSRSLAAFIDKLAADLLPYTLSNPYDDSAEFDASDEIITGFDTDPAAPIAQRAIAALADGMGHAPENISYNFATDGRHMVGLGAPILGYAPGDESEAHTAGEKIQIAQIGEALRGHVNLLRTL
ncbi:MAG: M20/M25/M40 family metallo-hydrolase [Anaerolineae bacterium]|nr:M20/M25/M40 family metallo-hydrolase [Anaerolineae bacterium]MCO5199537.1 M20/M25/M40 family metallo-hydrolase [Anaerolineae bacterium]MCO5205834.1 M20/M25/M40 family metallo-hydrolase [Anaerolineae bacterium]